MARYDLFQSVLTTVSVVKSSLEQFAVSRMDVILALHTMMANVPVSETLIR